MKKKEPANENSRLEKLFDDCEKCVQDGTATMRDAFAMIYGFACGNTMRVMREKDEI